jgi:MFS family permease
VPIADKIGRRKASIISFIIGIYALIILTIGIYINNDNLMLIGSFLCGLYASVLSTVDFILTCEFCT